MEDRVHYSAEERIAWTAHEANRAVQAQNGDDMPSLPWICEPRSLRRTAVAGVRRVLTGLTPEQNHEHWLADKLAQGWSYGNIKDPEKKTHPCMVPWADLPASEKRKARLFHAIVLALSEDDGEERRNT
jgi:hypothetical protein